MGKNKALTGAAGEYYVAFQLSARGYAVGFTPRGTKSADLLVNNLETGKSATIQVKTMANAFVPSKKWGPYWKWRVGVSRGQASKTFLYAFVDLKGNPSGPPDVFIVPSSELPSLLENWKDSSGRVVDPWCNIEDKDAKSYRNRWVIVDNVLA